MQAAAPPEAHNGPTRIIVANHYNISDASRVWIAAASAADLHSFVASAVAHGPKSTALWHTFNITEVHGLDGVRLPLNPTILSGVAGGKRHTRGEAARASQNAAAPHTSEGDVAYKPREAMGFIQEVVLDKVALRVAKCSCIFLITGGVVPQAGGGSGGGDSEESDPELEQGSEALEVTCR